MLSRRDCSNRRGLALPLVKLKFKPGVDKEGTDYENTTGWSSSDKIRFREGYPESIGGWVKYSSTVFVGLCRSLLQWTANDGANLIGLGTSRKLYVESGETYFDVTPIRASSVINANPFAIVGGSAAVTVTDTSHGAIAGDFVTFSGATSSDANISAAVMNEEYAIDSVASANTYIVTMSASAAGTDSTEGGSNVTAAYQISIGLDTSVIGTGWGVDTYGAEGWGVEASNAGTDITAQLRVWTQVPFGEDLIANIRNGGIYQWDRSGGFSNRAVNLKDLAGADTAPTICRAVVVAAESRHLMALACDPYDNIGTQDPLLIRWADAETLTTWTPDTNNTAGSLRLNTGSQIITGLASKRDILVWTDTSLNSISYVGPPFFFGTKLISSNTSIMGPKSAIEVDGVTYWMGSNNFYMYDGATKTLPCTLRDDVFININNQQTYKTFASSNVGDSEVTWFYCTTTDEITDYVTYNYSQQVWYGGTMARTAWVDRNHNDNPIAASTDFYLYNHEYGLDDGSTNPVTALNSYIESSTFEPIPGDGWHFTFINRVIPDVTFVGSEIESPTATITLTPKNFPGGGMGTGDASAITRSATTPVEAYTKEAYIRLRGRSYTYRIENNTVGVRWRQGNPRIEVRPDGRR
mgnify:FL=1